MLDGPGLQVGQEPAPEAETSVVGSHPHAFDLGRDAGRQLQTGTADGFCVQPGEQEQPVRRPEFTRVGQQAPRGIEAGVEACLQLGEVGPQTVLGVGMIRVDGVQRDRRGGQQPVDLGHGGYQPGALGGVERLQP